MSMLGKEVIYNGGTGSFCGCTEPTELVAGKRYKVVGENVGGWQTDLQLSGVEGEFNSIWFNEVEPKQVFFAKATEYHEPNWYIGKQITIDKLHKEDVWFETVITSPVISVEHVYGSVYKIETENTVYITEVKTRTVG